MAQTTLTMDGERRAARWDWDPARRQPTWGGMNWIRKDKRLAIYLRDDFRCQYCGAGHSPEAPLSLDHVTCRTAGGGNGEDNLLTSCLPCNQSRGTDTFDAWTLAAGRRVGRSRSQIRTWRVRLAIRRKRKLAPYRRQAKAILAARGSWAEALAKPWTPATAPAVADPTPATDLPF